MDIETIYTKIAAVPLPIKSQLGSDAVIAIIDGTEDRFHLPRGSSSVISKLLQKLEIKEIGPEYFAGELASELNLDKNNVLPIVDEIKKSILYPIKKNLADYGIDFSLLDQFKMPPVKDQTSDGPKIIQDIGPAIPSMPPAPPSPPAPKMTVMGAASAPSATGRTMSGAPVVNIAPLPVNKMAPPVSGGSGAQAQAKQNVSDIGWSKTRSNEPVVKLDITPAAPFSPPKPPASFSAPAPVSQPQQFPRPSTAPQPIRPLPPTSGAIGEFERMGITATQTQAKPSPSSPSNSPTAVPAAGISPGQPPPMILHEDTSVKAVEKNSDFHLARPGGNAEVYLDPTRPQPMAKPAMLELGKTVASPKQIPDSQIMHYTEFKPSLSSIPTVNSGPRNISEITSVPQAPPIPMPIPKPPAPPISSATAPIPKPPVPPTPPPPSTAPKGKPIVKNFL